MIISIKLRFVGLRVIKSNKEGKQSANLRLAERPVWAGRAGEVNMAQ
jgi:hypothetical protein